MSNLIWECEEDFWTAPDGKLVPFTRYVTEALGENGYSCFYIVLHKFSKNTYVYLRELYGVDEQSAMEKLIKIGKVENTDRKNLQGLIDEAKNRINNNDEVPNAYWWNDATY